MDLTDINEIKELLGRHGFRFSHDLGQNFLCRAWVPESIAHEAGLDVETGVLEVGPGIGCLTVQLARAAKKVISVELDKSLLPVLGETLRGCDNAEVVFSDIMKLDLPQFVSDNFKGCERVVVCANLPYNITSPVLTAFAEAGCFDRVTVMIQREVAKRICGRENTADYGAFTVLMQWHYEPKMLFDVSPDCFIPAPKVTSSVITLERRAAPPVPVRDEKLMFAIVRAAFNQRRKTLANALVNGLGGRFDKERLSAAMTACGLDERVRGEALSIGQFAALTDQLTEKDQ